MNKINLNQLRSIQIKILQHFKKICDEYHLQYFLCNGSLLGAIKYQGFIPWDDDIDVCMLRSDYNRLIQKYHTVNRLPYVLFSLETTPNFLFPFAKMSDNNTILIENNIDNGVELGVNIDIFPIDGFGNTSKEIKKNYDNQNKLRNHLYYAKINNYPSSNMIKNVAKYIIASRYRIKGAKNICQQIIKNALRSDLSKTLLWGNTVWGFYGVGEAHRKQIFDHPIQVIFEGESYQAPELYDEYLRGLYGDYLLDPPLEKQKTHHEFDAYYKF